MQADAADIEAGDQNGAIVGEEDEDLVAEADERARARHTGQPAVLSVAASPDGYAHSLALRFGWKVLPVQIPQWFSLDVWCIVAC